MVEFKDLEIDILKQPEYKRQIIIVNDDYLKFNILFVNGYSIWFLRIRRSIHLLRTRQVCFVCE